MIQNFIWQNQKCYRSIKFVLNINQLSKSNSIKLKHCVINLKKFIVAKRKTKRLKKLNLTKLKLIVLEHVLETNLKHFFLFSC